MHSTQKRKIYEDGEKRQPSGKCERARSKILSKFRFPLRVGSFGSSAGWLWRVFYKHPQRCKLVCFMNVHSLWCRPPDKKGRKMVINYFHYAIIRSTLTRTWAAFFGDFHMPDQIALREIDSLQLHNFSKFFFRSITQWFPHSYVIKPSQWLFSRARQKVFQSFCHEIRKAPKSTSRVMR